MSKEKEILYRIEGLIQQKKDRDEIMLFLKDSVDFFCERISSKNTAAMNLIKKFVLQRITREENKRKTVFKLVCKLIDLRDHGKSTTFIDYMEEIEHILNRSGRSFWAKSIRR